MKAINLLLILTFSLLARAQAQGTGIASQAATTEQRLAEDLGVDRLRSALLPAVETRNAAQLLQIGTNNTFTINQLSLGSVTNQAAVVQTGTGNVLGLDQAGSGNQTSFSQTGDANRAALRQNGTANAIAGRVAGNDNGLDVNQNGTGNEYSTQLTGSHGRYTIEQLGNNNSLTQREISTSPATPLPGYSVQQQGSGIHLTIEQSKAFP